MSTLTLFGACAVSIMLLSYTLKQRSAWWVLMFALACAATSLYGSPISGMVHNLRLN